MRQGEGATPVLAKLDELGPLLTGNPGAGAAEGLAWIRSLATELKLPTLGQSGLNKSDFEKVAAMAKKSSSMRGNPVELSEDDLFRILEMERRQDQINPG